VLLPAASGVKEDFANIGYDPLILYGVVVEVA